MAMVVPKYVLKRIFPADAVANVDVDGDGKPDHVQITAFNVMIPISVAEINSWNLKLEQAGKMFIDGKELDPTKFFAYFEGKKYQMADFYQQVNLVVPVGGRAKLFYPWPGGLAVGMHEFKVMYSWQEFSGEVVVERDVTQDRFCLPYSPNFE